jgi:hypothetical protein
VRLHHLLNFVADNVYVMLQESSCSGGDENTDPNQRRRGRKRRSLTESHPAKNPLMAANNPPGNIFFETDL